MNIKTEPTSTTNQPPFTAAKSHFLCGSKESKENFYHPDHLSSSSWITDIAGTTIQHLQYLPFGETRVDQRTTSWNSRYSFSAKEKDEESGYGYFGARYYDSDLSIWLSVDPMASNTPGVSPYAYCVNNPIRLIDPDGQDWYENESGKVVWNDNVTKKSGAPKGGTYIGANDKDIVKHFGFNPQKQSETSNTKGMVLMGEEGYHATQAETTTDLTTTAITGNDKNAISASNSQGKVFKELNITANITTRTAGSTEGYFQVRGGLSVDYGGKTHAAGLESDKSSKIGLPGSMYLTASVTLSANQLSRNKSVGAITVSGRYGVKGFDGQYRPMVIHGLIPYPRTFKHKF